MTDLLCVRVRTGFSKFLVSHTEIWFSTNEASWWSLWGSTTSPYTAFVGVEFIILLESEIIITYLYVYVYPSMLQINSLTLTMYKTCWQMNYTKENIYKWNYSSLLMDSWNLRKSWVININVFFIVKTIFINKIIPQTICLLLSKTSNLIILKLYYRNN